MVCMYYCLPRGPVEVIKYVHHDGKRKGMSTFYLDYAINLEYRYIPPWCTRIIVFQREKYHKAKE